jgi:hypothetical protein
MRGDDLRSKPLRLRDFVRVGDCFFSVVGYRNSTSVKCFLRYIPDAKGDRVLGETGRRYRKISHDEAVETNVARKYMKSGLFLIPHEDIDEVYKPEERLEFASRSDEVGKIVRFFSAIPKTEMGVTGSRLLSLEGDESDVDFIVYGKWWFEAREKLRKGIESGELSEPDEATWDFIYKKRKVTLPYDVFLAHERRKYHRAFLGSTYFDLLYVRGYDELDRDVPEEIGSKKGKYAVRAKVLEDSLTFDYPAYYPISHPYIKAVLSFTHTYVGQAFMGESIIARGELEEIDGELYLIVGTKREVQDEFIVSLDLLEREGLKTEFEEWYRGQA